MSHVAADYIYTHRNLAPSVLELRKHDMQIMHAHGCGLKFDSTRLGLQFMHQKLHRL